MHDFCSDDQQTLPVFEDRATFAQAAQGLADDLYQEYAFPAQAPPLAALERVRSAGILAASLPRRHGGLGLGTELGGQAPLLRILASIGGADLALGRIVEGHVNALILINAFATEEQQQSAANDVHAGLLFGVWNTGESEPVHLRNQGMQWTLEGAKTFATGVGIIQRPIVTAEAQGWRMTMPRMEARDVAPFVRIDAGSWHPFGMESSQSLTIEFKGAHLLPADLLGSPGDFYRDPLFRGGAIRFAAVQTGMLLRLTEAFADWVTARGRQGDPYQIARLGEMQLLAQDAVLWIERAAAVAEQCMHPHAPAADAKRMVRVANMTRLAIQRAANALLAHVIAGVGAHGLLRPARFERMIRDLTMYLRQPNPDGTLADVGRSLLLEGSLNYWTDPCVEAVS